MLEDMEKVTRAVTRLRGALWSATRPVIAFIVGRLIIGWTWFCYGLGNALFWAGGRLSNAGSTLHRHVRWWRELLKEVADSLDRSKGHDPESAAREWR